MSKSTPTILHIAPTPFFSDRGCHIRIAGIVRCLEKLNFNNVVCTYHTGRDLDDIKTYRIGNIKNYTKTSAGPSPYKFWADLKLLYVCLQQYRRTNPVVIHAHLHEGVLIGLLVKLCFFWRRTPLVADMQGSLTGELETYGVFRKYSLLKRPVMAIERTLLFLSNKIVCSSQHSVDMFKDKFPESSIKVSLAQDGADKPSEIDARQLTALRERLGIDPTITCIVYSGALLESKGLNELQTLILGSKDYAEKLHFLVIGYPTNNLQAFIKHHDLQRLCTLTGQVDFDSLADYLALGNVAVDPKNSDAGEGSGKSLNYMASGMPVVAFDTTNNRKFLGNDARLARDPEDALDIMLTYVDDHDLAKETGQAMYDRFTKHFSWDVCQKQLLQAYEQVAPDYLQVKTSDGRA